MRREMIYIYIYIYKYAIQYSCKLTFKAWKLAQQTKKSCTSARKRAKESVSDLFKWRRGLSQTFPLNKFSADYQKMEEEQVKPRSEWRLRVHSLSYCNNSSWWDKKCVLKFYALFFRFRLPSFLRERIIGYRVGTRALKFSFLCCFVFNNSNPIVLD